MKKIFTFFAAMLLVFVSYAQLSDGALAPDFSLYEINKTTGDMITDQTINLYDMLNDYKVVYIDVSATTCNPCYAFHYGGTLEHLYNNYGPNSSINDSRVLFIEGASTGNSWETINGSAGDSYWDCTHVYGSETELVPYPVIPLRIAPNYPSNYNSFHSGFNIGYFPTIYMICPNRMVYNLTNSSSDMSATYHNVALQWSPAINNTNDAFIGYKDPSAPVYYCEYNFSPSITLQNVGSANLTSATLRITDGNNVQTVNWTGNLAQFATTQVPLSTVTGTENGAHSVVVEIVDVNGVADEGSVRNSHTESFWVVSEPEGSSATQDFSSEDVAPWCIADFSSGGVMPSSGLFVYNDALLFYAYNISSGKKCEFVAPMMDFTNISDPKMTFDYAHRRYSTSNTERLRVKASADCGTTWTTVWEKYGATLATVAGTYTSNYTNPTAAQFKNAEVDLTAFAGQSNVIVKFEFISGYGNNVWVDNINITNGPLAVESVENSDLSIFPNPVKDVLNINYDKAISQIDVYDVNGKLVKTLTTVGSNINVSDLSDGVYMLNIQTEEGLVIRKIVKE